MHTTRLEYFSHQRFPPKHSNKIPETDNQSRRHRAGHVTIEVRPDRDKQVDWRIVGKRADDKILAGSAIQHTFTHNMNFVFMSYTVTKLSDTYS